MRFFSAFTKRFPLFIILIIFIVSVGSQEYRLKQIIQLSNVNDISEITVLKDNKLAVRTSSVVHVLSGPGYKQKVHSYNLNTQKAKMCESGFGSLQNDGSILTFNKFAQQNYTFEEADLQGDMLVTQRYALIGKINQEKPTLKKLNFETIQFQTIVYPKFGDFAPFYPIKLVDLMNGDIAFVQDLMFYILDNETLEIKQNVPPAHRVNYIGCLFAYKDVQTNQTSYLIGRGGNSQVVSQLKKSNETGQYTQKYRFNTPDSSSYQFTLTLTGADSGVRVGTFGCYIEYWNNFHSILDITNATRYYMKLRQKVAVSYDETFFVVRNDSGFYEIYDFKDDYDVVLNQAIFIGYNDYRRGATTSDDKAFFVSMSNSRDKHNIAKVVIEEGEYDLVTDKDGSSDNHVDFALLHAKYNRMLTIAVRNTTNYFLQLRAIDDLRIIDEFPLRFNFTVAEYKLLGSSEWDLNFALGLRVKSISYDLRNDTILIAMKIQGDKIINLNISTNVSFNHLQTCSKYILDYKERFSPLRFLHFSNLSLAFTINQMGDYPDTIRIEKNILIQTNYGINTVFNLQDSNSSLGSFYTDDPGSSDQILWLIFPKRKVLIDAPISIRFFQFQHTKKIYNLTSPPVKYSTEIEGGFNCHSQIFYIPPQKTSPKCNYVFYVSYLSVDSSVYTKYPQIVRYSQCSKEFVKYPVIEYGEIDVSSILFISTDKKYIIILVNPWNHNEFLLEIRPIASLKDIIFHKVFPFSSSKYRYLSEYNVDIVKGNMILIHSPEFVTAYFIDPKEFADSHQMAAINHFDVTGQSFVALAGQSLKNSKSTRIIVKAISSENYLFSTTIVASVEGIALSQMGERVAVFSSDSIVRVWDISSKALIFTKKASGVTEVKFRGENTLLVKVNEKQEAIILGDKTASMRNLLTTEISEGNTVSVYSNGELVTNLNLPSQVERIVSVSMFPNDQIIAATDANKLYIWTSQQGQLRSEDPQQIAVE